MEIKRCNLGCGKDYREEWLNVDISNVKKDMECNLNRTPFVWQDNAFEEIEAKMILEHLDNPIKALKEMIRISKPNAIIRITVPHCNSYAANTDIQHKTKFTENSFEENLLEEYGLTELKLISKRFVFKNVWKRFVPFKGCLKIWLNGIYDDIEFVFEVEK